MPIKEIKKVTAGRGSNMDEDYDEDQDIEDAGRDQDHADDIADGERDDAAEKEMNKSEAPLKITSSAIKYAKAHVKALGVKDNPGKEFLEDAIACAVSRFIRDKKSMDVTISYGHDLVKLGPLLRSFSKKYNSIVG